MLARAGKTTGFAILAITCFGIALVASRYIVDGPGLSDFVLANGNALPWLKIHVAAGAMALVIGPWQFVTRTRIVWKGLHRWFGRVYAVACLTGATAGLILAFGTVQGPIARSGFAGLALAWLITTAMAWIRVRGGDYAAHRRWMIRSFALTLAAVTLRIYLPIPPGLGYDFDTGYRLISWLCWVPNLLLAELYVRWRPRISS
jgi:uncharacterized membrane protein